DWAMMPGARKVRYGTLPVLTTCSRLKVCPKISSHRAGWIRRVNSSVRSYRSFCSSTRAKAPTGMAMPRTRRHPRGARTRPVEADESTDTAGRPWARADLAETRAPGVLSEFGPRVVAEDVLQGGAVAVQI